MSKPYMTIGEFSYCGWIVATAGGFLINISFPGVEIPLSVSGSIDYAAGFTELMVANVKHYIDNMELPKSKRHVYKQK